MLKDGVYVALMDKQTFFRFTKKKWPFHGCIVKCQVLGFGELDRGGGHPGVR